MMSPLSKYSFLPGLALLVCSVPCLGETVAIAIEGEASSGTLIGESSDPKITDIQFERGPDLLADTAFPGFYDSANWDTGNTFPGSSSGSYVSFSFQIAPGYVLDPTSLRFNYVDDGRELGPLRIDLRSNSDAFATSLFLDTDPRDGQLKNVTDLSLDSVTGFAEYRFYGYAASDSSGILGFANNAGLLFAGNPMAVMLEGDLTVVPEPRHVALAAGLAATFALLLRRRRIPPCGWEN